VEHEDGIGCQRDAALRPDQSDRHDNENDARDQHHMDRNQDDHEQQGESND
jgi:hypothetical protein